MTIKSFRRSEDATIVNKMLGGNNGPRCKHCGALQFVVGHREDCMLLKIRPSVLLEAEAHRADTNRKNANRQIIFRNERPNTTSKQRFRRAMNTRPRNNGSYVDYGDVS